MLFVLLVAVAAILAWACQSTDATLDREAAPATAAPATPEPPAPDGEVTVSPLPGGTASGGPAAPRATVDDPGPEVTRRTGTAEIETRDRLELAALGHFRADDGHLYVLVDFAGLSTGVSHLLDVRLDGDTHGVAVLGGDQIAVRLAPGADVERDLDVTVLAYAADYTGDNEPRGIVQPITIERIAQSTARDDLEQVFMLRASLWYGRWRDSPDAEPFEVFAAERLGWLGTRMSNPTTSATPGNTVDTPRRARRSDLGQMMDLYTGMTSVNEALQTDRGLGLRAEDATERTVSIADVEPTEVVGHPWAEMIEELAGEPVVETLAAVVPDDVIYLHFGDLRDFVVTSEELDQWLTPVSQALEGRAGSAHFTDRYEAQLAVQRSVLSKQLGHLAADSVALVVGDPYLREGTDVSLVFEVANASLLDTTLANYAEAARAEHPDLTERSYEVGGHTVVVLETPDRSVYRHRLELDDGNVLVISNSPGAIERFVEVEAGQRRALAEAGDFRYLRTVYPHDPEQEDGFLFIGDALVSRVIGPEHKILQARRMAAHADLMAVNHAALLQGTLDGALPQTADEIVAAGWLEPGELAHVDGEAIALDLTRGAHSARWGRAAALTPLVDAGRVTTVSPAEAEAYRAFADEYQEYWRRFVDPIGVRLKRSHDGRTLHVDGRMLPLIERTEYDDLIETVGKMRLGSASTPGGSLRWTVALGQDWRERDFINSLGVVWLGEWAMVGVDDHSALWEAAIVAHAIPELGHEYRTDDIELAVVDRLPLWVAVDVTSEDAARQMLSALRLIARDVDEIGEPVGSTWRDIEVYSVELAPDGFLNSSSTSVTIHLAVVDEMLVASMRLDTLQARIDEALDGTLRPRAPSATDVDQARLAIAPGAADGWMARTVLGMLETELMHGHGAANRAESILRAAAGDSLDADAHRRLGLALLGYEPHSPADAPSATVDTFTRDDHGLLTHPVYGSQLAPRVPELPVEGSPLTAAVEALHALEMQVGFEGEGKHRGLHVKLDWTRR